MLALIIWLYVDLPDLCFPPWAEEQVNILDADEFSKFLKDF